MNFSNTALSDNQTRCSILYTWCFQSLPKSFVTMQYDTGNQGSWTCPITHEPQQAEPNLGQSSTAHLTLSTTPACWRGIGELTAKKSRLTSVKSMKAMKSMEC